MHEYIQLLIFPQKITQYLPLKQENLFPNSSRPYSLIILALLITHRVYLSRDKIILTLKVDLDT